MADKLKFESWKIASEKGETQSQPKSGFHTFLVVVWLLLSLAILVLGLYLIFNPNLTTNEIGLSVVSVLAVIGVIYIFAVATRTTKRSIKVLLLGILLLVGAACIFFLSNALVITFRLLTGIAGIVISLFMFADVWREKVDGAPFLGSLIWGLLYLVISIAILFTHDGTRLLSIMTGLYVVMLSGNVFFEALCALFHVKPHLKKNFIITMPMAFAAFLPMAFFREINTMVKEEPDKLLKLQEPDKGKEPDLIVYIHTRAGFIPGFGHCDLCYKGKVYSYGDYDQATWKLDGFLADGVMATVPPEKHIEMALKDDKKILMAYGIKLTEDLQNQVQEKLDQIMAQAYRWKPKAELAAEGEIKADPASFKDVGSVMFLEEDAQLYKFKEGSSYKTYYALGENCSEVVNDVVGQTGIGLFKLNGIITPGTYLEYLDELYELEDSIVIDRRLYMLDENGKPVLYPLNPKDSLDLGQLSM